LEIERQGLQLALKVDTPHHPTVQMFGDIAIFVRSNHGHNLIYFNKFVKRNQAEGGPPSPLACWLISIPTRQLQCFNKNQIKAVSQVLFFTTETIA